MQDRELAATILEIRSPWRVERVELKLTDGEVHVHLEHDSGGDWPCPECGKPCPLYDRQPARRWRHLDTCQLSTILHAQPPRSNCSEHGPRTVRLPWAEPNRGFTALFAGIAIEWLKVASRQAVADQLGLSWDEVHAIQQRAVTRGLARRKQEAVEHIGVDEKAFARGHHYFTLVNDLDRGACCSSPNTAPNPASTTSGRVCPMSTLRR